MVYVGAVPPSMLQYGSPRVQTYQLVEPEQAQQDIVDLLKESKDITPEGFTPRPSK
jgi:hypothetical protein